MSSPTQDVTRTQWRKSSISGSGNDCVELAPITADDAAKMRAKQQVKA